MEASSNVAPRGRRATAVAAAVAVLVVAGACSDSNDGATPDPAPSTTTVGSIAANDDPGPSGADDTGASTGAERADMAAAIGDFFLDQELADNDAMADCLAAAILDLASIERLAELGVTLETIDELYYGPFIGEPEEDALLEANFQCSLEFGGP